MLIRRLRERKGWTQAVLAEKARMHRIYLAQIEASIKTPALPTLEKLAKVFRVRVGDLLGGGTTVHIRLGTDPMAPFLFAKGDRVVTTGFTSNDRGVIVDGLYSGSPPSIGGTYRIIYDVELEDGRGFIKVEEISLRKIDE